MMEASLIIVTLFILLLFEFKLSCDKFIPLFRESHGAFAPHPKHLIFSKAGSPLFFLVLVLDEVEYFPSSLNSDDYTFP